MPDQHLKFIPGWNGIGKDGKLLGTVEGITDIGKKSIEIYNLNRCALIEKRQEELEKIEYAFGCFAINDPKRLGKIMENIHNGVCQYSAAAIEQFAYLYELVSTDSF